MDLFFGSDSSSSDDEIDVVIAIAENMLKDYNSGLIHSRNIINRDHIEGHYRLIKDYFAAFPKYPEKLFRRRFRMHRDLFIKIKDAVEAHDSYFVQKRNAAGKLGLSSYQKVASALRILAYGVTGDLFDEYIQIATEAMKRFVKAIISIFGEVYLRRPNEEDVARLLIEVESRGTPGMLGSIDCMHWEWKNCPTEWSGMYTGSCSCKFSINGHNYEMGYYLADGIYPEWATFMKTIPPPRGVKRQHFAQVHEALRKDVERAFGILQPRFAIVRGSVRYFNQDDLKDIMTACIIMHNMIVESERHLYLNASDYEYDEDSNCPPKADVSMEKTSEVHDFIKRHKVIRDKTAHTQLQEDLVEHLWKIYSES
ncbi:hypothetical protein OROMI_023079 [Orobanche minor]